MVLCWATKKVSCYIQGQERTDNRVGKILDAFSNEQLLVNAVTEKRSPAHQKYCEQVCAFHKKLEEKLNDEQRKLLVQLLDAMENEHNCDAQNRFIRGYSLGVLMATEGLQYSINQEDYLKVFLTDGEVPIDDSASERALRNFTIGRKNWMTINTVRGAQASAVIYSITETARANSLNVYYYIKHLLTELPQLVGENGNTEQSMLEPLMPWSKTLPADCYSKRRD